MCLFNYTNNDSKLSRMNKTYAQMNARNLKTNAIFNNNANKFLTNMDK